ncbi:MAG: DUF362 domain-containing protein [Chloroflexi bacterium]|nr:DUF362 domain-containing protein [Chloroflexota bacterium]
MKSMTRRSLLAGLSLTGLGLLAASCSPKSAPAAQEQAVAATAVPATAEAATAVSAAATPASAAAPDTPAAPADTPAVSKPATVAAQPVEPAPSLPYMAVVRGSSPEEITTQAIEAIGGMKRFVQPGYNVVVKPNICNASHGPEYASTTNPIVVATLTRLALDAGAKRVQVMDYPFSGSSAAAYKRSGIEEAVLAVGGEMEVINPAKFVDAEIPEGVDLKKAQFYKPILDADLLINVPIAKHHNLARLTLAGKNLLGVIQNRGAIHLNMGPRIADLVSLVRPQLNVMDAVRMLMDHGPTGGNLTDVKEASTVIASHDLVAVDAYATTLFGLKPEEISYVAASAERGLGVMDLGSLDIAEIKL